MKQILSIITAVLAVSAVGTVHAQSTPWYGGVAFGQSRSNVDAGEVNDYVRSLGYGSPSTSADDKDTAYRLSLGYRFSPVVSVEGFYADMGTSGTRTNILSPSAGSVSAGYKAKGYGVDLLLFAPVMQTFSVFGRVGVIEAKADADFAATGSFVLSSRGGSKNKTGQHFGVGVQYEFSPVIGLRGEVETYRKMGDDTTGGELKVDVISLGAVFRF